MSASRRNTHSEFINKFSKNILAQIFLKLSTRKDLTAIDSFNVNGLVKFAMGLTVVYGDAIKKSGTYLAFMNEAYINDHGETVREFHIINFFNGVVHLPISAVLAVVAAPVVVLAAAAGGVVEAGVAIKNGAEKQSKSSSKNKINKEVKFVSSDALMNKIIQANPVQQIEQKPALIANANDQRDAAIHMTDIAADDSPTNDAVSQPRYAP